MKRKRKFKINPQLILAGGNRRKKYSTFRLHATFVKNFRIAPSHGKYTHRLIRFT